MSTTSLGEHVVTRNLAEPPPGVVFLVIEAVELIECISVILVKPIKCVSARTGGYDAATMNLRLPTPRLTLTSRILALTVGLLLTVVVITGVASVYLTSEQIDREFRERSLTVASSVASLPVVRAAVLGGDPDEVLQPLAESVRAASGADFVVITDAEGIRFSHPNPDRIGERVSTDPGPALAGERWSGTEHGTLGVSVRGKVPILGPNGRTVIGIVSVGFLREEVIARLGSQLLPLGLPLVAAFVLGGIGSVLLARHVKRQTFGLEPTEIASLLEQREAILHGIREGAVAVDNAGTITLVNDEARRLLGLDAASVGRPVDEVVPAGRIRDALLGDIGDPDEMVLTDTRILVVNRMPTHVRGELTGTVITIRDRTEIKDVQRELDRVQGVADALRAQAHEFSNRLHTIAGLIELGRGPDAIALATDDAALHQELVESHLQRIGDPTLSALLLAKSVVAGERGVTLLISDDTVLLDDLRDPRDLITVVGNLVDNAIEAVASAPAPAERWVSVSVRQEEAAFVIRVHDSGPGVDEAHATRLFERGFTTSGGAAHGRGLGLALVQQVMHRRGGQVTVTNDGGAVFTVRLPHAPGDGVLTTSLAHDGAAT